MQGSRLLIHGSRDPCAGAEHFYTWRKPFVENRDYLQRELFRRTRKINSEYQAANRRNCSFCLDDYYIPAVHSQLNGDGEVPLLRWRCAATSPPKTEGFHFFGLTGFSSFGSRQPFCLAGGGQFFQKWAQKRKPMQKDSNFQ